MIFASLLPPAVAIAEGAIDAPENSEGGLFPEEAAQIARAADVRRRSFTAGRVLARRALAAAGGPEIAIPWDRRRAPVWPAGFTGSITHGAGWAAAAAAALDAIHAVGIDVESIDRFHPGLERHLCVAEEIAVLARLNPTDRQAALAAIFSAKEAFYKCQHHLTGAPLGFRTARVELDAAAESFVLRLLIAAPPFAAGRAFHGRYRLAAGQVAAAIAIGADEPL